MRIKLISLGSVFLTALLTQAWAQKPELVVETPHTLAITSVAFSPDTKLLASCSADNTVKLWDAATGRELQTLRGHSEKVNAVAFSPDGRMLASGGEDKTIKLWDLVTGRNLRTLRHGEIVGVRSVAFSSDGLTLISSGDFQVKVWEVATGKEVRTIKEQGLEMAFSASRGTLATTAEYRTVRLWDSVSGLRLRAFRHSSDVVSLALSRNGKTLAMGGRDSAISLWDVGSGRALRTLYAAKDGSNCLAFSNDGNTLASCGEDNTIRLWTVATGRKLLTLTGNSGVFKPLAFSADDRTLASGGHDQTIVLWDVTTGEKLRTIGGPSPGIRVSEFSLDRKTLAIGTPDNTIKLFEVATGRELRTLRGHSAEIALAVFSADGRSLASASTDRTIKIWDIATGRELRSFNGQLDVSQLFLSPDGRTAAFRHTDGISLLEMGTARERPVFSTFLSGVMSIAFSQDLKLFATGSDNGTIKLWETATGSELLTFSGKHKGTDISATRSAWVSSVGFSGDGRTLASGGRDQTVKLWDVATGRELRTLSGHSDLVNYVSFSADGRTLASTAEEKELRLWDVDSGRELRLLSAHSEYLPKFSHDGRFLDTRGRDGTSKFWRISTGELVATLTVLGENDWVATTPDGRFDTNKSLDRIEGLHWTINNEILKPVPLDVFMRQYYEPGLLLRVFKGEQFKPLPPIAELNRVQPKVVIKEVKPSAGAADLVDVTVEVESVTENVSISATNLAQQKRLTSGAFDLRLFRDGQLVGVSSPKERLASFIKAAPRLIVETKSAGRLLDTPEDRAWREANDIFKLNGDNLKLISPTKVSYTFRNLKLPKDGRKEVAFTAYAFNADRVKSTTTEPFKFAIPNAVASSPRQGRAYLISIGVNASENSTYDLRYAANDARKMQEILGARLKADSAKYSAVIQVPLISDYGPDKQLGDNKAQKAIIQAVFSLLAGNEKEVSEEVLKQIPNRDKIKAVEPEDTLIIAYSGHGYADESGIFYLLPYDIGKDTTRLTTDVLQRMISSDELSLWMQDITAAEMIMIIDACYSSAAVQGDGFKPGPMGSRGLGQLAYDKDMKILSATQANNIALELGSLEQGLLSYALLQDGIIKSLAPADQNRQVFASGWLSYPERRVPELYKEVKEGKRDVLINGQSTKGVELTSNQPTSLNLQQPSLFDFKRRNAPRVLFVLP